MIKQNSIGKARTVQAIARTYNLPLSLGRSFYVRCALLCNHVNEKKCNGRKRGTIKLSGFAGCQIDDFYRIRVSYTLSKSANMRVGSRSFRKYAYGDLRKLFKQLAPYRVASAQKAESK